MKTYAIIVTYNGSKWIEKCLTSLNNSSISLEIIIIDNFSTDNTIDIIEKNFSNVILIKSEKNLGFAKANNIGIKYALEHGVDYVFLLNQDAWVENDTIEKLLNSFKQIPAAGIVSPIHLNGNKMGLDCGFVNYIANYNTANFISDLYCNCLVDCYETKFVNAAAWLISRKCIEKVGGFDTSVFFHYGEDDDYCNRVIYHGFKIIINTKTTICHDRDERNGKRPKEFELQKYNTVYKIKFSNILISDEQIIKEYKYKYKINFLHLMSLILRLKFKRFLTQRKLYKNETIMFKKIQKSRNINKNEGLNWLD